MTSVSHDSFSTADPYVGRAAPWSQEAEQAVLAAVLLDQDAALNPTPGRRPFQRLNRAEYTRAVSSLLSLDVDVSAFLPPDTISMIIRNIVRQLETPDRLRGRMIGVNMVFFQGGPQLGELEAGAVASWLGPVVSVVSGGLGCVFATAWVAVVTPALRHYRST